MQTFAVFANENEFGVRPAFFQQNRVGEAVVGDDVGPLQETQPLDRQQVGVAGAGSG